MTRLGITAAILAILLSPLTAYAGEKTVVLNVDNATCALCGPTVKKALSRVEGVKSVLFKEADAGSGAVATVTFDDATADVPKLIAAATNAGYPARLKN
jgi:periplasmic mercuric ion binding protein